MKRGLQIALNVVITLAIVGYIVYSSMSVYDAKGEKVLSGIEVDIENSDTVAFVTADQMVTYIAKEICTVGTKIEDLELHAIEKELEAFPYLSEAEVMISMDGVMEVRARGREAVVRIMDEDGSDFYLDSTFTALLPVATYRPAVLAITGRTGLKLEADSLGFMRLKKSEKVAQKLNNFLTFVSTIEADKFLREFVGQIYVTSSDEKSKMPIVEIVPRVGGEVVLFGEMVDVADKFDKLKSFYRGAYGFARIDTARVVDLRFKDQVVVR